MDPGHRDLISAVRFHSTNKDTVAQLQSVSLLPPITSKKGKQRRARLQRQQEAHQSVYQLSNKRYYELCGFTRQTMKQRGWRQRAGLDVLFDQQLSTQCEEMSKRSWKVEVYGEYVKHVARSWQLIWQEVLQLKYRKLRFDVFQRQQQAVVQVTKELCGSRRPESCVVLWGAGSFGPTSKGHAAAPNKLLRRKVADNGLEIRLVDEYRTSQRTACCLQESVYAVQHQVWSKRRKERWRRNQERLAAKGFPAQPAVEPWMQKNKLRGLLYCKHSVEESTSCDSGTGHHHYHGCCIQHGGLSLSVAPTRRSSRPWNRDVCSALNIMHRAYAEAHGELPTCFERAQADPLSPPSIPSSPSVVESNECQPSAGFVAPTTSSIYQSG